MAKRNCEICNSRVSDRQRKLIRGYKKGKKFRERINVDDFVMECRIRCFNSVSEFSKEVRERRTTWWLCPDCYRLAMGHRLCNKYHRLKPTRGIIGKFFAFVLELARRFLAAQVGGLVTSVFAFIVANAVIFLLWLFMLLVWQIENWVDYRLLTDEEMQPLKYFERIASLQPSIVFFALSASVGGFFGGAAGSAVRLLRPMLVAFCIGFLSSAAGGILLGLAQADPEKELLYWILDIVVFVFISILLGLSSAIMGAKSANFVFWGRWPSEDNMWH